MTIAPDESVERQIEALDRQEAQDIEALYQSYANFLAHPFLEHVGAVCAENIERAERVLHPPSVGAQKMDEFAPQIIESQARHRIYTSILKSRIYRRAHDRARGKITSEYVRKREAVKAEFDAVAQPGFGRREASKPKSLLESI